MTKAAFLAIVAFAFSLCAYGQAPAPANSADGLFRSAQEALKRSKFAEAQSKFAEFVAKYPSDPRTPEVVLQKGNCEMKLRRDDDAVRTWQWLTGRFATSDKAADAMEALAAYYQSKSNHKGADELRQKIMAQFPEHPIAVN